MGKKLMMALIIIIIFALISISSPVNSTQLSNNLISGKTIYVNDINEVKPLDEYEEIISFINGGCGSINIKGLVINKPIEVYSGDWAFDITGWRKSETGLLPDGFRISPEHIIISRFYGFIYEITPDWVYSVRGIAIGDIEWS